MPLTSRRLVVPLLLGTLACSGASRSAIGRPAPARPCCLEVGRRVAADNRVAAITARRFTHADYWAALDPLLRSKALRVTPVGTSTHGRALRAITFGTGPTTVFLWSQMHGDESTATMALADLLSWFGRRRARTTRCATRSARA